MTAFCSALETARDSITRLLVKTDNTEYLLEKVMITQELLQANIDNKLTESLPNLDDLENQSRLLKLTECYIYDFCNLAQVTSLEELKISHEQYYME